MSQMNCPECGQDWNEHSYRVRAEEHLHNAEAVIQEFERRAEQAEARVNALEEALRGVVDWMRGSAQLTDGWGEVYDDARRALRGEK